MQDLMLNPELTHRSDRGDSTPPWLTKDLAPNLCWAWRRRQRRSSSLYSQRLVRATG